MGRGKNRGRQKRKDAERQAHDDLSDEELDAALAEIASGSDRVAAILGGALVQNTLMGALAVSLEDRSDLSKLFDSVQGPLSSFYAQILMAKAMGLFDNKIADALHTVRSVRNQFAHAPVSLSFEDPSIAKKCGTLAWLETPDLLTEGKCPARIYFEHACYELTCQVMAAGSVRLHAKADQLQRELANQLMSRRMSGLGKLNSLLDFIPADTERGE